MNISSRCPDIPGTWEAFFTTIPIETQKQECFASRAQTRLVEYLAPELGKTRQETRLAEHILGHLIAAEAFRGRGSVVSPVHVVHHMAYDCGDPNSFISQVMDVADEEYDEDEFDDEEPCNWCLYARQGSGRTSQTVEIQFRDDYGTAEALRWERNYCY
jgi:hypothetical protein